MTKDRRLGRGLAALLGTPNEPNDGMPQMDESHGGLPPQIDDHHGEPSLQFDQPQDGTAQTGGESAPVESAAAADEGSSGGGDGPISDIFLLNVYDIDDNPFQPRREFGQSEIASLSESLKEHDMLQPILVRRIGERYQLISGERRLRAAIQAGWAQVPARIKDADDRLVAELAIVENLQRKDLNAIEKALSFKRYLDEHHCTQDDLARRLKIDRSTIANLMRLLELPSEVLDAVRTSDISAGHARALLPLGEEAEQIQFCGQIRSEGWSVRETERRVSDAVSEVDDNILEMSGERKSKSKRTESDQVASLEQELRIALGTKIEIRQTKKGRGRIVVHFSDHDEFDRLRALLNGSAEAPEQGHQADQREVA